jgi:V/A-type H+/Na+-transporting ATPase subunit D
MPKIKYTKNELKQQKDNLARFTRYLPTLELKKMQLIAEVRRVQDEIAEQQQAFDQLEREVAEWVDVFAEPLELRDFFQVAELRTHEDNIAGIDIPVFDEVIFEDREYDFFQTPLWVDRGLEVVKEQLRRRAQMQILRRQEQVLRDELRVTVQRIKLFEEVKIPEAKDNIRVIRIFLGDQQTAAVVRGKISKSKLEKRKQEVAQV